MATKLPKPFKKYVDKYYVPSFGEFPLNPADRMALGIEIAPEFTEALEEYRARALYQGALDDKTKQLMAVSHLAARASAGTYWHAKAARKYGASWAELHKAVEIAALFNGFSAINEGAQALVRLWKEEQGVKEKKGAKGKGRPR
jgi:alkylhydroperoxidase/carboxymuconolactone decarboxylase family protein YurZ